MVRSAIAEKPAAAPSGPPPRATGRVRKGQQEDVISTAPKGSKVVAKQQPFANRAAKPAPKGPALRNGDAAAPARPDSGNLSRAGSAPAQSRRGGAVDTTARAQADGKLGAPATPAINRKRKGGAAGGVKEQAAEAKPPPAKRQRSGTVLPKAAAAAATKARRKSPRGEGAWLTPDGCTVASTEQTRSLLAFQ